MRAGIFKNTWTPKSMYMILVTRHVTRMVTTMENALVPTGKPEPKRVYEAPIHMANGKRFVKMEELTENDIKKIKRLCKLG